MKSGVLDGWGQSTNLKGKKLKQKILHKEKLDLKLAKKKCPDYVDQDKQFCAGVKKGMTWEILFNINCFRHSIQNISQHTINPYLFDYLLNGKIQQNLRNVQET